LASRKTLVREPQFVKHGRRQHMVHEGASRFRVLTLVPRKL